MFRLVFLAFHGSRTPAPVAPEHPEEHEPTAEHGAPGIAPSTAPSTQHPAQHQAPGTGHQAPHGHLHDAPPAMAIVLIVLAIGSIVAGWVGLGGRFEHFLEPSFAPQTVSETADASAEVPLMLASIAVALGGIGAAFYYFLKNRAAATGLAARFAGLYRVLLNKYYVDEIYDAGVVQPIRIASEDGLWKVVDVRVIDGAVNGVGEIVGGSSELLRRLQTGSVRAYAASLFVGVVVILGYYLLR
jgi:NADH-quinone oxidoreductase subunit L